MNKRPELLAPAGNYSKMLTAFHFGADAVYAGGYKFGLRSYAGNFDNDTLEHAVKYSHSINKKLYVTLNIYAYDNDFNELEDYIKYLNKIDIDAVIVSDLGLISLIKNIAPALNIHISTQANTTNFLSAKMYAKLGAERVVLARELSLENIKSMQEKLKGEIELECFVHGAMCVAYSGRCLLSNYLTGRSGNRGECVQACRWEYYVTESSRLNNPLQIKEDERGSYIMNSKDLNMLSNLKDLCDAGISSFKIEGRMKTEYYIATVVNAYKRALDNIYVNAHNENLAEELNKVGNRGYTTAFFYKDDIFKNSSETINYHNSISKGEYDFIAVVKGYDNERESIVVEQRNRFFKGDILEILSPFDNFNKIIAIDYIEDENKVEVIDAKLVQQILYIKSPIKLSEQDILRKKRI